MNYKPELDMLSSLFTADWNLLMWGIEVGCIDISHEISLLSQYWANPRVCHLEVLYHVFCLFEE
jgi:hypothetical protein